MPQILLQTRDLTKKYGELKALDSVSLTLMEGDVYGLIGRNGAGKTTFFKCIMGLAKFNSGSIGFFDGKTGVNAARRRIGFMINPSFFPYLDPYENLRYLCRVKGIRDRCETVRLLELVGLGGVRKPFKSFSLGMKHRLGIAGALLGTPSVVVLDEPVNGLDPQGIIEMRMMIKNVHAQTGSTFIISSHILSELDLVATRFGFIEQGVLLKEITHTELHEHTKKTLLIETGDVDKARETLRKLGIENITQDGNRLALDSHIDRANEIALALVNGGVELYGLHRRETTLEEYFVRLVSGDDL